MQYTTKVWWNTGRPNNQALVLARFPYTGKYPEWFDAILRLECPNTKNGWLEMAVKMSDTTFEPLESNIH